MLFPGPRIRLLIQFCFAPMLPLLEEVQSLSVMVSSTAPSCSLQCRSFKVQSTKIPSLYTDVSNTQRAMFGGQQRRDTKEVVKQDSATRNCWASPLSFFIGRFLPCMEHNPGFMCTHVVRGPLPKRITTYNVCIFEHNGSSPGLLTFPTEKLRGVLLECLCALRLGYHLTSNSAASGTLCSCE